MKKSALCMVVVAVSGLVANAVDSVWTGAVDGAWTNAANWTAGVPGLSDTATFGAQGSLGATSINLTDMELVGKILVTGAGAPKYTFGTDAAQVLKLPFTASQNGSGNGFFVDSTVPAQNVPVIVATLGGHTVAIKNTESYQIVKNDSSGTLVMNDFGCTTGDDGLEKSGYKQRLIFSGTGLTEVNGTLVRGAGTEGLTLNYEIAFHNVGKVRFKESIDGLFRIHSGGSDVAFMRTMEIDEDVTIALINDWSVHPTAPLRICGEGALKFPNKSKIYMQGMLSVSGLYSNMIDVAISRDNVETGDFILYGEGVHEFTRAPCDVGRTVTLQFTSGNNALRWITFAAPSIGLKGDETGVCSAIEEFRFLNRGCLRYTGTGETMDRTLVFGESMDVWTCDSRMRIEQCGTGDFVVTGAITSATGAAGASLYLAGDGADGIMRTPLVDQPSHPLTLTKEGAGRWVLEGSNTFTGATAVSGGTLALGAGGTLENSPVTLSGGTFAVTAAESKSVGSIQVGSGVNRIAVADGATLSAASIVRNGSGVLDITLGNGASFVCAAMANAAPSWITVGGKGAAFGADGQVAKMSMTETDSIAARGGVIADGAEKVVGIVSPGDAGPITLEKDSTKISTLVQRSSENATVSMPSQTLTLSMLMVNEGAANLTIGSEPGEGTLSVPSGVDLAVENSSEVAAITVNADLDVPSGRIAVRSGTLALAQTAYDGTVLLSEGTTLVLTNESTAAMTVKPSLAAERHDSAKVVRTGDGLMKYSIDLSSYGGDFVLAGGTNEISATLCGTSTIKNFGSESGILYVTNGATLFVNDNGIVTKDTKQAAMTFGNKRIHFSGAGANGTGAYIVRDFHPGILYYATLDGDTTFVLERGSYVAGYININKNLDMNGHSLTVNGDGYLVFPANSSISNAGRIDFRPASGVRLELACYPGANLGPSDAPPIVLRDNVRINSYAMGSLTRALLVDATAVDADGCPSLTTVRDYSGTNVNHLAGPLSFADSNTGIFRFCNRFSTATLTLGGQVSGPGGFKMFSPADRGCIYLAQSNNTFTGGVTIEDGESYVDSAVKLGHPTSAPDYSQLAVTNGRIIAVAPNWNADALLSLASTAALGGDSFISVDTEACGNSTYVMEIDGSTMADVPLRLAHDGVGTLSVTPSGTFSEPMAFGSFGGTLEFNGGKVTLGRGRVSNNGLAESAPEVRFCGGVEATLAFGPVSVGSAARNAPHRIARMKIDDAIVKSDGSAVADHPNEPAFIVGNGAYGDAILEIADGAEVATGLAVGYKKSHGAVYQTGGSVDATGAKNWGGLTWIGHSNCGYGAYLQSGGDLYCADMRMAQGIGYTTIRQTGGNVNFGQIHAGLCGPLSDWVVSGGHTVITNISLPRTDANVHDTKTVLTVEADADVAVINHVIMAAGSKTTTAIVNMNGGRFSAYGFRKYGVMDWQEDQRSNRAYVNFNGGTFAATSSNQDIFGTGVNAVDAVTLYEGGAAIDTSALGADGMVYVSRSLSAPTGLGVASVPFTGDIVVTNDFVGPPGVLIIGDGFGATAVCDFNRETRRVAGVRMLTPGRDYTWAKAVLDYGYVGDVRAVVTNDCTLTSAAPISGGLTKKGAGRLTLDAANTYSGDTVIEGGELVASVNGAIPSASAIVFKGGLLSVGEGVALSGAKFRFDLLQDAQYPGSFAFPSGSSITVENLDKAERSVGSYTIATFTGGISGDLPSLSNAENLPYGWRMTSNGRKIKIRYIRGSVFSIR